MIGEYKIEVDYSQQQIWGANLKLDYGWEVPVSFDALINKLKDVDVVVFAGGISSNKAAGGAANAIATSPKRR